MQKTTKHQSGLLAPYLYVIAAGIGFFAPFQGFLFNLFNQIYGVFFPGFANSKFRTWVKLKILLLAILIQIPIVTKSGNPQCDFELGPKPETTLLISPSTLDQLTEGSVICLQTGYYHRMIIHDIKGTEENPITIINYNGEVIINTDSYFGIVFRNSSHVKLLGNGHEDYEHGIAIKGVMRGNGISVDNKSTNVEIAHLEVGNTAMSGIMVKTDPRCDDLTSTREKFSMYNIIIRNNYIHNTNDEGIYIGSSFFNGLNLNCDGADTLVFPHVINGVQVTDNYLHDTGRNSIQVSSAIHQCIIGNNMVIRDSQRALHNQMNGIQIGGGSKCNVYNNKIIDGLGAGIHYFGFGPAYIFNNLILNPGKEHNPDSSPSVSPIHGIFIRHIYTPTSAPVNIFHNTIINPKTDGIYYSNNLMTYPKIQNNIIINPGSRAIIGNRAFIQFSPQEHPALVSHNYLGTNCKEAMFTDTIQYNFSLHKNSPLINQGLVIEKEPLFFDILGRSRPNGISSDPGAYENHNSGNSGILLKIEVYPNPATDSITLSLPFLEEEIKQLRIFDVFGKLKFSAILNTQLHNQPLSVADLSPGIYHIIATTTTGYATNTFVKL